MYKYSLDKHDFLRYQLYTASYSSRMKRQRIREWVLITLAFVCIAFLLSENKSLLLTYIFLIIAAANFLFYPLISRYIYRNIYKNNIAEHYTKRENQPIDMEITDDHLILRDPTGDIRLKLNQIIKVFEIKDNLFIRVKTGSTIIIPRRMQDYEKFKTELQNQTKEVDVEWVKDIHWKWR